MHHLNSFCFVLCSLLCRHVLHCLLSSSCCTVLCLLLPEFCSLHSLVSSLLCSLSFLTSCFQLDMVPCFCRGNLAFQRSDLTVNVCHGRCHSIIFLVLHLADSVLNIIPFLTDLFFGLVLLILGLLNLSSHLGSSSGFLSFLGIECPLIPHNLAL